MDDPNLEMLAAAARVLRPLLGEAGEASFLRSAAARNAASTFKSSSCIGE
jgi:hypothetical protein